MANLGHGASSSPHKQSRGSRRLASAAAEGWHTSFLLDPFLNRATFVMLQASHVQQQQISGSTLAYEVMEAFRKLQKTIAASNSGLAEEINYFADLKNARNHQNLETAIKEFLLRLYDSIALISEHHAHLSTLTESILETYCTFFAPIRALLKLPWGDFIAARMFLYLANGLINESAPDIKLSEKSARAGRNALREFCISLDDALLEPLRRIWTGSNKCEEFSWVFTGYPIQPWTLKESSDTEKRRARKLAQVLSPEELVAAGGISGRSFLYAAAGGEPDWQPFEGGVLHVGEEDTGQLLWKQVGSDGPIRANVYFAAVGLNGNGEESTHSIEVLRRSRQFAHDARTISQPNMVEKRRLLAGKALFRAELPLEIKRQILNYLEKPRRDSYLWSHNIAETYIPFPQGDGPCSECDGSTNTEEGLFKRTCPQASIYVWNLPLRLFNVFHQDSKENWQFCRDGPNCSGHHDNDKWEVEPLDFVNVLEAIVANFNYDFHTFSRAGFGAVQKLCLDSPEEDEKRADRLFGGKGPFDDSATELMMRGGLGGLIDSMIHNRVLNGAWRHGDDNGHPTCDPQWALGRNLTEQGKAEDTMEKLHGDLECRWCFDIFRGD